MCSPVEVRERVLGERELEILLVADVLTDALVPRSVEMDDRCAARHVLQRQVEVLELDALDA